MSRTRKTFTVSKGKAFVGSVLGEQLADTPDQELAELTDHMEDHFAEKNPARSGAANQTGAEGRPPSMKPKRVCIERGCPKLTVAGKPRCVQHRRPKGQQR